MRARRHYCGFERADAFSLTPALSRWEREKRSQRWAGAHAQHNSTRARGCSLSQRERARVRENGDEDIEANLRQKKFCPT